MPTNLPHATLAILVGGSSSRMGSAKGALHVPQTTTAIIDALVAEALTVDMSPVLIGDASPYAHLALGVPRVADSRRGEGPVSGLLAALEFAAEAYAANEVQSAWVVLVACDMPFVTRVALRSVVRWFGGTLEPESHAAIAPRDATTGYWQPMLSAWNAQAALPVVRGLVERGTHSFQSILNALDARSVLLDAELRRALHDWDTPEDMREDVRKD